MIKFQSTPGLAAGRNQLYRLSHRTCRFQSTPGLAAGRNYQIRSDKS